jgi:hypothetical protein
MYECTVLCTYKVHNRPRSVLSPLLAFPRSVGFVSIAQKVGLSAEGRARSLIALL